MEIKSRFDHFNINVTNLERSIAFYEKALGLKEHSRKKASDGSFILVYLTDNETGFLLELTDDAATDDLMVIGQTTEENTIVTSNYTLQLDDLLQVWERKLEPVFPCQIKGKVTVPPTYFYERKEIKTSSIQVAHPRAVSYTHLRAHET